MLDGTKGCMYVLEAIAVCKNEERQLRMKAVEAAREYASDPERNFKKHSVEFVCFYNNKIQPMQVRACTITYHILLRPLSELSVQGCTCFCALESPKGCRAKAATGSAPGVGMHTYQWRKRHQDPVVETCSRGRAFPMPMVEVETFFNAMRLATTLIDCMISR